MNKMLRILFVLTIVSMGMSYCAQQQIDEAQEIIDLFDTVKFCSVLNELVKDGHAQVTEDVAQLCEKVYAEFVVMSEDKGLIFDDIATARYNAIKDLLERRRIKE